jgi:hypothetical protein
VKLERLNPEAYYGKDLTQKCTCKKESKDHSQQEDITFILCDLGKAKWLIILSMCDA